MWKFVQGSTKSRKLVPVGHVRPGNGQPGLRLCKRFRFDQMRIREPAECFLDLADGAFVLECLWRDVAPRWTKVKVFRLDSPQLLNRSIKKVQLEWHFPNS